MRGDVTPAPKTTPRPAPTTALEGPRGVAEVGRDADGVDEVDESGGGWQKPSLVPLRPSRTGAAVIDEAEEWGGPPTPCSALTTALPTALATALSAGDRRSACRRASARAEAGRGGAASRAVTGAASRAVTGAASRARKGAARELLTPALLEPAPDTARALCGSAPADRLV